MSGQLLADIRMPARDDGEYAPANGEYAPANGEYAPANGATAGPRPRASEHRGPGPRTPLGPM
ncbi:hypothetical protein [Streptomyces triticiradicis]|uniref:Uncharacterized protein n=1 Tax=Streptomyces triticiradicis TaxID=2651189 RepID=A0A7J5DK40_9ACTN|nr:hypothetical protein [Streptomyces triticiradicis]KAB1988962.1 hypothetical protein F8144_10525 [Streptomyces triticiradicis]